MEWVETTGRNLDDAKERALDQLGVDEQDAEFEVLEEPRPGLFGRLRGEARVRARVRPTAPRPKVERRDRRRKRDEEVSVTSGESAGAATAATANGEAPVAPATETAPEIREASGTSLTPDGGENPAIGEVAAFLAGLADAFDLDAEVRIVPDGDGTEVGLHGDDLGLLIGPRGVTLQAVQDLARALVARGEGEHPGKVRVDVGGYRQKRREALTRFAQKLAEEVEASGSPKVLEPMNAADRKVIHDAVGAMSGVRTVSEGEDPYRRVVIVPNDGS
jgi:spoIIIJ-associated protein